MHQDATTTATPCSSSRAAPALTADVIANFTDEGLARHIDVRSGRRHRRRQPAALPGSDSRRWQRNDGPGQQRHRRADRRSEIQSVVKAAIAGGFGIVATPARRPAPTPSPRRSMITSKTIKTRILIMRLVRPAHGKAYFLVKVQSAHKTAKITISLKNKQRQDHRQDHQDDRDEQAGQDPVQPDQAVGARRAACSSSSRSEKDGRRTSNTHSWGPPGNRRPPGRIEGPASRHSNGVRPVLFTGNTIQGMIDSMGAARRFARARLAAFVVCAGGVLLALPTAGLAANWTTSSESGTRKQRRLERRHGPRQLVEPDGRLGRQLGYRDERATGSEPTWGTATSISADAGATAPDVAEIFDRHAARHLGRLRRKRLGRDG